MLKRKITTPSFVTTSAKSSVVKKTTAGKQKSKLPKFFESLMWSYRLSGINPETAKEVIIVQTINSGDWKHWQWIADYYGKSGVKKVIEELAMSEFRASALALAKVIFGVEKIQYATRSDKITATKNS